MSRASELGQPGFTIFWEDLGTYVMSLSDEELGRALRTTWCEYADEDPDDWPVMVGGDFLMFKQLQLKIDIQCDKYEATCEKNRGIAQRREAARAAAGAE